MQRVHHQIATANTNNKADVELQMVRFVNFSIKLC